MRQRNQTVVVGGGPAGCGAALAAARGGQQVLLIERNNCLGGMATAGLLGFWGPLDNAARGHADWQRFRLEREKKSFPLELMVGERIIKGIPEEFLTRLEAVGAADIPQFGFIPVNPEGAKFLLESLLLDSGVEIIYETLFVDAIYVGSDIELLLANKAGLHRVQAQRVIDASGDGDIAVALGADFKVGRESDGKCQGVTLVFRLGNVRTDPLDWLDDSTMTAKVNEEAAASYKRGEFSFPPRIGCVSTIPGMPGVVTVNSQHTFNVNGTNPEDITQATINGRKQIQECVHFFRRYIPGCEDCYLIDTAHQLGIRESRRIVGNYVLTRDDVLQSRQWEDGICEYAYDLDMHFPVGDRLISRGRPTPGTSYDIPYRCLIPQGLSNVLVAGRCISATHEALSSYRLMTCCMALGQAAGTAAFLSAQNGITTELLDPKLLREQLCKDGAIV